MHIIRLTDKGLVFRYCSKRSNEVLELAYDMHGAFKFNSIKEAKAYLDKHFLCLKNIIDEYDIINIDIVHIIKEYIEVYAIDYMKGDQFFQ